MKVLLATDGSDGATTALISAAGLLHLDDCEVHLLCVVPSQELAGPVGVGKSRMVAYERQAQAEATRIVHEVSTLLQNKGLRPMANVERGVPSETVVRRANQGEYDVIVVGAYGLGERKESGLGSIASAALMSTGGTVLIGRETVSETESGFKILIAVDGSAASERAVRKVAEQFQVAAAEVTLLFVEEVGWVVVDSDQAAERVRPREPAHDVDLEKEVRTELQREADVALAHARGLLARFDIGCRDLVREGDPAQEILSEAEAGAYDVIVLGAKGVSDLKHTMLGSVSAYVARNAPCSVAVVKAW